MTKETKKSIISWTAVGIVFIVALVLIFQQGKIFEKQLRATVFPLEYVPEEGIGRELMDKAMEQAKRIAVSACLKKAFDNFEKLWNQECQNLGLEERCELPKNTAAPLLDNYQEIQNKCY